MQLFRTPSLVLLLIAAILPACGSDSDDVEAAGGSGGTAQGGSGGTGGSEGGSGGTGGGAGTANGVLPDQSKLVAHVNELASEAYEGRVPGTEGGAKAVEYVRKQFENLNLTAKFTGTYLQPFDLEGVEVPNVIGVLEGTDPALKSEVIMVTAHLDHLGTTDDCGNNAETTEKALCPGADDDASGVAVVLEMARVMVEGGVQPKRTVVFATFNAEEQDLAGSAYYVQNPLYPLASIKAVLNVDMVGLGDGSGITLLGTMKDDGVTQDPATYWIKPLMTTSAQSMGFNYQVLTDKPEPNSDCYSFYTNAAPCVFVWSNPDGAHNSYHTAQDTADKINPTALLVSADMVWAALKPLATQDSLQ